MGHLQHFALSTSLPADRRGHETVTEGWAFLFQYLLAEPAWLTDELRMPRDAVAGWLDFGAFRKLTTCATPARLSQLRLLRREWAVHRAEYAGLPIPTGFTPTRASMWTTAVRGPLPARVAVVSLRAPATGSARVLADPAKWLRRRAGRTGPSAEDGLPRSV
jgi:hypothetical protein